MRVLAAFDKFKDSLDAAGVANAVIRALQKNFAKRISSAKPLVLSDGGEGFLPAMSRPLDLKTHTISVAGPLGTAVQASYGINTRTQIAVIESALACGLYLVPTAQRNPLNTTTHGVGELIRAAYDGGARKIIMGVGGSATNDGGLGALSALGLRVVLQDGTQPKQVYGRHLTQLASLQWPAQHKPGQSLLPDLSVEVACDVNNPFVGPNGATFVFGPQKGASPADQIILDKAMTSLADKYVQLTGVHLHSMTGAGAAGGIAGGFSAVLGAQLKSGVTLLGEAIGLEDAIKNSDVVFTGEGSYDATTAAGKVVSLVQSIAKKHQKPLVVICGINKTGAQENVFDLVSMFDTETCMTKTSDCLEKLVEKYGDRFPGLSK